SLSPLRGFAALVPAFGALLLIGYLELSAGAAKFLDGSFSRFLGELSFPLYLIHVPIICSLGARIYLDHGPYAALLASVVVSLLYADRERAAVSAASLVGLCVGFGAPVPCLRLFFAVFLPASLHSPEIKNLLLFLTVGFFFSYPPPPRGEQPPPQTRGMRQ